MDAPATRFRWIVLFIALTTATHSHAEDPSATRIPPSSATNAEDIGRIAWDTYIHPGLTKSELVARLDRLGVATARGASGTTYTANITTGKRDYLFCNDRLYAIVEGEFVDNARFTLWMEEMLNAKSDLGEPSSVELSWLFSQITVKWDTAEQDSLIFLIRTAEPDKVTWSQQLYNNPIGEECGAEVR